MTEFIGLEWEFDELDFEWWEMDCYASDQIRRAIPVNLHGGMAMVYGVGICEFMVNVNCAFHSGFVIY